MSLFYFVRPIQKSDIAHVMRWSQENSGGLSTLLNHPQFLEKQLLRSIKLHQNPHKIHDTTSEPIDPILYFVLCAKSNMDAGGKDEHLLGCSGLKPSLNPDTTYLEISKEDRLVQGTFSSPLSELCALFLSKDSRGKGLGKLLSWSRFLYLHLHLQLFAPKLIAQFRGELNKQGQSPFWNALRPYLKSSLGQLDFQQAHSHLVTKNLKLHLPEPLPTLQQLALPFSLPTIHHNTIAAFKMLQKLGFEASGSFDPIDGGMHALCSVDQLMRNLGIRSIDKDSIYYSCEKKEKTHLLAIEQVDNQQKPLFLSFPVAQSEDALTFQIESKELYQRISSASHSYKIAVLPLK